MTSRGIPLTEIKADPFFKAGCLNGDSPPPNNPGAVSPVSDSLRGPGVVLSAVFLIGTHGHARHGHGVHVHRSHVRTATVHVHHAVRCGASLVGELRLREGAIPGQVS